MRAALQSGPQARLGILPLRPPARSFALSAASARRRTRLALQPRFDRAACCAAAGADATCGAEDASAAPEQRCAVSFAKETPPGDERPRDVCTTCGFVDYKNPKVVVAAVVVRGTSVLLCRRAIEPAAGKWGFPQGYLELGESARAGAAREALEEAGAAALPGPLLAVYDVPGSVQLVYLARLRPSPGLGPRPESSDVRFFDWDALPPAEELAFPTNAWALEYAREVLRRAPEGSVWRDCAEAVDGSGDAAVSGAWFAPQQRSKTAAPLGYTGEP